MFPVMPPAAGHKILDRVFNPSPDAMEMKSTQRGVDASALNEEVQLPHFPPDDLRTKDKAFVHRGREINFEFEVSDALEPHELYKTSATIGLDDKSPPGRAVARVTIAYKIEINRKELERAKTRGTQLELHGYNVAARDPYGGVIPAKRPHEELHANAIRLAVARALDRSHGLRKAQTRFQAHFYFGKALRDATEISDFVNAKLDARTDHGTNVRAEARYQRRGRIEKEIERAENLRAKDPEKFDRLRREYERQANLPVNRDPTIHEQQNRAIQGVVPGSQR
jgi:hypothetical protein